MTQHLIGLGDDAPRDTSPTLAAYQATPHAELLAQLMDPNIPKTEREHAAVRELERLTAENAALRAEVEQLNALVDHLRDNIYERMTGVPPLKATAPKEG
jgi:hypothetical protein